MAQLRRTPGLRTRLFTPEERDLPPASLAARFAAKEAIAKALGAPVGMRWHDCTVTREVDAAPTVRAVGTVAARMEQLGVRPAPPEPVPRRRHRLGDLHRRGLRATWHDGSASRRDHLRARRGTPPTSAAADAARSPRAPTSWPSPRRRWPPRARPRCGGPAAGWPARGRCCSSGSGNNGGDALLAGALLRRRGVASSPCCARPATTRPGAEALRRAGGRLVPVPDPAGADGATARRRGRAARSLPGEVRRRSARPTSSSTACSASAPTVPCAGPARARAASTAAAGTVRPSSSPATCRAGWTPPPGRPTGPVLAADVTVTFGAAKPGLLLPGGPAAAGRARRRPARAAARTCPRGPALAAAPGARRPRRARGGARRRRGRGRGATRTSTPAGCSGSPRGSRPTRAPRCSSPGRRPAAGVGMARLVPPDGAPGLAGLVLAAVPEVVVQRARRRRAGSRPGSPGRAPRGPRTPGSSTCSLRADEPAVVDAGALDRAGAGPGRRHPAPPRPAAAHPARRRARPAARRPRRAARRPHRPVGAPPAPPPPGPGPPCCSRAPDTLVVEPGRADGRRARGPAVAGHGRRRRRARRAGGHAAGRRAAAPGGRRPGRPRPRRGRRGRAPGAGGPLRAGAVADALAGVVASARPGSWDHG